MSIPTISVIVPPAPTFALTFAPTRGAYPSPGVEPKETIKPPLGIWFWLISNVDSTLEPFIEVMPVKITVLIPEVLSLSIS